MNDTFKFFAAFALAGVLVGGFSRSSDDIATSPVAVGNAEVATLKTNVDTDITAVSIWDTLTIEARAAFVIDGATKETLFAKNADVQLPLASLTKVMNALTALSVAPRFALVSVTSESLEAEGDSGLRSDERWSLEKLLSFSLTASSNDGALAAAAVAGSFLTSAGTQSDSAAAFTNAMNREAQMLGFTASYFLNPTGLDESAERAGGYGSARDVSRLMLAALRARPELFDATTGHSAAFTEEGGNGHTVENTNIITNEIPLLRASKTGFTDLAGGNLSIIFDAGVSKPISITVLGSTGDGRFEDMKKLVAATLQYLQKEDSISHF